MQLNIQLPDNLVTRELLRQRNIPCLCRVKGATFELLFQYPLPEATGFVTGWTHKEIDSRAPAGAGGEFTHYCFGMVSLQAIDAHIFDVQSLAFFVDTLGWHPIVENGNWSDPMAWNSPAELEALEASLPVRKPNNKILRLIEALARNGSLPRNLANDR